VAAVAVRVPLLAFRRRRRGAGDYYTDNCVSSAWSALNPFCYLYLNRDVSRAASGAIESGFPAPPAPVPIAQTTLVPTGGFDVAGNPTYDVVPQTAAENQAANVAQLRSFFSNVAAQNAPDCSTVYNRVFNSGCGGSLWVAAVPLAIVAFLLIPGRRGRR
jgi:hypothetical protein